MNFIAEVRFFFSTGVYWPLEELQFVATPFGLVFFSPRVCSLDRVSEDLIGEVILANLT